MTRPPDRQPPQSDGPDSDERGGAHGRNDFTVPNPASHQSWGATGPTAYGHGDDTGGPVRGGSHDESATREDGAADEPERDGRS